MRQSTESPSEIVVRKMMSDVYLLTQLFDESSLSTLRRLARVRLLKRAGDTIDERGWFEVELRT